MASAFRKFGGRLEYLTGRFTKEALEGELPGEMRGLVATFGADVRAGLDESRAVNQAFAVARTIPPTLDLSRADFIVETVRAMDTRARLQFIKTCDATAAAALWSTGQALTGLSDIEWQMLGDRVLPLFHMVRANTQANFARRPSVDRILATGPDTEAAEADARRAAAELFARRDAIEARESNLQRVLAVLSAISSRRPADILAEALGNVAAAA